jgi:hypothetical protein
MKKALEAGIEYLKKELTNCQVSIHIADNIACRILKAIIESQEVMLKALDEEDKKLLIYPEIRNKYYELINAVGNGYPNETRHETALKYIKRAQNDDKLDKPEQKKSITDYLLNYAVNTPEPENPDPQGSVEELAKFMHSVYEDKSKGVGWSTQESCRVDWDDLPEKNKIVMRYVAYNVMQWLKTKPAIDPEIKKVYDEWKKNDGIVVMERAFEREMWNCIKAHVERGGE